MAALVQALELKLPPLQLVPVEVAVPLEVAVQAHVDVGLGQLPDPWIHRRPLESHWWHRPLCCHLGHRWDQQCRLQQPRRWQAVLQLVLDLAGHSGWPPVLLVSGQRPALPQDPMDQQTDLQGQPDAVRQGWQQDWKGQMT